MARVTEMKHRDTKRADTAGKCSPRTCLTPRGRKASVRKKCEICAVRESEVCPSSWWGVCWGHGLLHGLGANRLGSGQEAQPGNSVVMSTRKCGGGMRTEAEPNEERAHVATVTSRKMRVGESVQFILPRCVACRAPCSAFGTRG